MSERAATEAGPRETYLPSIAYQHPRYTTGGESKKDHGVTPEQFNEHAAGRTLCGRPLGRWYFPRGERFTGAYSFHCSQCVRVGLKLGYLDPERLDEKYKPFAAAIAAGKKLVADRADETSPPAARLNLAASENESCTRLPVAD